MKSILFKEPLFNAVVEGAKTQTRRIIKSLLGAIGLSLAINKDKDITGVFALNENEGYINPKTAQEWIIMPKYKVGEILYLKEPYFVDVLDGVHYNFNCPENQLEMTKTGGKWKNKLFMPESAARFFIKITGVRVERLQDISEEDCIEGGIIEERPEFYGFSQSDKKPQYGIPEMITETLLGASTWFNTPQQAYAAMIDKINGKGTWNSNPFVFVYTYEKCNKNGKMENDY